MAPLALHNAYLWLRWPSLMRVAAHSLVSIITIKDYEFANKLYCESCRFNKHVLIEGKYIAYYENGARYLLCEGCSKFSIITHGVKEMHLRN